MVKGINIGDFTILGIKGIQGKNAELDETMDEAKKNSKSAKSKSKKDEDDDDEPHFDKDEDKDDVDEEDLF